MARFKKMRRYRARSSGGYRRSRSSNSGGSPMSLILPAMAYGAARQQLSALAAPLTSKLPLGNYADEVVMGGLGYLAATRGSGIVRNIGRAVLTVEAASVGNQLLAGVTGGQTSTVGSTYTYG